jgi:hypothetical protein
VEVAIHEWPIMPESNIPIDGMLKLFLKWGRWGGVGGDYADSTDS